MGTPRWGAQVYDGSLDTNSMSIFIEAAAAGDPKDRTSLTRLPTLMARKAPKVKPPPPPPSPPRPEADTAGAGEGEGGGDAAGAGKYSGMDKEQILEAFRKKQAQQEVARRKAMDEEVCVCERERERGRERGREREGGQCFIFFAGYEETVFVPCRMDAMRGIRRGDGVGGG